jgi:hypothetical protein
MPILVQILNGNKSIGSQMSSRSTKDSTVPPEILAVLSWKPACVQSLWPISMPVSIYALMYIGRNDSPMRTMLNSVELSTLLEFRTKITLMIT